MQGLLVSVSFLPLVYCWNAKYLLLFFLTALDESSACERSGLAATAPPGLAHLPGGRAKAIRGKSAHYNFGEVRA